MSEKQLEKSYELRILCPVTRKQVRTGFVMGLEAFKTSNLDNNSFRCPVCGNSHTWQKQDVLLVQVL